MPPSTLQASKLELRPLGLAFGLSARRLWEHTELGQISVFACPISADPGRNDSADFVDVVSYASGSAMLLGCTMASLKLGRTPVLHFGDEYGDLDLLVSAEESETFLRSVKAHLDQCSFRRATRVQHAAFLPAAAAEDEFGLPYIFSAMRRRLQALGPASANKAQWVGTIENLQKKGLRLDELSRSGLNDAFDTLAATGVPFNAMELLRLCDFSALRLSVFPVVKEAKRQLQFSTAPAKKLVKTKRLHRAQAGQSRALEGYDRILGYRVELVEHQTLWGPERHWQAVTHDGQVIRDEVGRSVFDTPALAAAAAAGHARQRFPKRLALGRWSHIAWTGGEDYREWLITLPYYPASYFSSHFSVRNVLAHVRCDVREGANGERVLLLQEVQSDWAQNARRAISDGEMALDDPDCPPFLKEWSSLAMKLVLLHAAHHGLDVVAWTRGDHQAQRYRGLGATGLGELYDRTLPREVNRLLKPFGAGCESIGVFVPTNFSIRQSETGYDVFSPENELLGTSPTLEEARAFVPDGGHELLYDVHGARLGAATRKAILTKGFPAWG